MNTKNIPTIMLGIRDEFPGWELVDPSAFTTPKHHDVIIMDCYWIVIDGCIVFRKVNDCLDVIYSSHKAVMDKIAGNIRREHNIDVEVKQFDALYIPGEYIF